MQPTSFFDIDVHIQVETFSEYLDVIAAALKTERASLDARLMRDTQDLDEETRDLLYDHQSDRWHNLAVGFPARFFNSFLIALCSWLESELDELARRHEGANPDAIKLKEVAGDGIARSRLYLKRVVGMPFPDDRAEWATINILRRIRNQIVHAAGMSRKLDQNDRQLLAAHGCEGHDGVQRIALTEDFCRMALETVRTFFSDVEKGLPATLKGS